MWKLTVISLLFAANQPAFAAGAGMPEEISEDQQDRCFCIKPTGGLPPYFIDHIISPECKKTEYDPGKPVGKPIFERLLFCDQLRTCLKEEAYFADRKRILDKKTAEAEKRSASCCKITNPVETAQKPSDCDNKCLDTWKRIKQVLANEMEKLDKKTKESRFSCFQKKAAKAGTGKNTSGR